MTALVPSGGARLPATPGQERQQFGSRAARDAAIVRLAQAGEPPWRIEERVVVSRQVIYMVLTRARQRGTAIPHFSTSGRVRGGAEGPALVPYAQLSIRTDLMEQLGQAAQARGLTDRQLARRILETAIEDGMVDAILDDGSAT